ncbi:MAG TPA: Tim44/TimA family putative adaptor protein [Acetobacteraceae bacterium]|nr:Tim44/TimA family putative adaptor protein [Acetobacteraceae bacterium]
MGASGSFPIDLVLFGMIAAFLVLRLRSILGRRTGYERPPQGAAPLRDAARGPVIDGRAEPAEPVAARPLPDPASPAGRALARMRDIDRSFDAGRFLEGAEGAFRLIVGAFAAGNRDQLRPLLTQDTLAVFEQAIAAREQAGETHRTEVRAIHSATIEEATLLNTLADITVRFVTDQVNVTLDRAGQPVAGADAVTEIADLWTFERDLAAPASGPAWRLSGARSA